MLERNFAYTPAFDDAHSRERLERLHPPQWRNPRPVDRYDLAVIGADRLDWSPRTGQRRSVRESP